MPNPNRRMISKNEDIAPESHSTSGIVIYWYTGSIEANPYEHMCPQLWGGLKSGASRPLENGQSQSKRREMAKRKRRKLKSTNTAYRALESATAKADTSHGYL